MLELPESYTISKQIEQALSGKIISYIELIQNIMRIKRNFQKTISWLSISMMKQLFLYQFRCMVL